MTEHRIPPGSRRDRSSAAALWMLVTAAVFAFVFIVLDKVFVHSVRGQRIDDAGLAGSVIGRDRIIDEVQRVLDLVSVGALVVAVLVVGAIGLARGRPGLAAMAVALLAAANVSTHLLKTQWLTRPDLGVDKAAGFAHNTLPSGHTTVAISVSAALLIVVGPGARAPVALLGATASAGMGVATLSAGWHRPSDAMAAYLVVGAWGAVLASFTTVITGLRRSAKPFPWAMPAFLALVGAAGLAGGFLPLARVGAVPEATGRRHLFLAYAGGSAAVVGMAFMTVAGLLALTQLLDPARHGSNRMRSAEAAPQPSASATWTS